MVKPAEPELGNMEATREVCDDGFYEGRRKLQNLVKEYLSETEKKFPVHEVFFREKWLKRFLRFSEGERPLFKWDEGMINRLKLAFVRQRNRLGLHYSIRIIIKALSFVRGFMLWLKAKSEVQEGFDFKLHQGPLILELEGAIGDSGSEQYADSGV